MTWQTIGFEKNKKIFEKLIESGDLAHAYLFTGQAMIGKRTFALEIAQLINGDNNLSLNPNMLVLGQNIGNTITIDQIREAKNFMSLTAQGSNYKVLIIDNAHSMTDEAQNALLKLLEEPSPRSLLLLISDNPNTLLSTITSRCQEIWFAPHPRTLIETTLTATDLSPEQQRFLIELAHGRIGLIKNLIQRQAYTELKDNLSQLITLRKAPMAERFQIAQALAETKDEQREELQSKILAWLLYAHIGLDKSYKSGILLRNLLDLYSISRQSQYNLRLALESFMLELV